ncbi:MAG TPA: prepilin-type N-terminal cleavage/methylation domain-containing protein, partial [Terricaulis sp.]|nr:prepilin-type N-terminal cleavage/methylation domain-containing protein [Terricaulis sp.]
MTARAANDSGFTLVEALVSLLVFSLIASGCVAMLMQSVESQRRLGAAHETLRELQTTRALLANDLAQLV